MGYSVLGALLTPRCGIDTYEKLVLLYVLNVVDRNSIKINKLSSCKKNYSNKKKAAAYTNINLLTIPIVIGSKY